MIALLSFMLAVLASPFRSKSRLEAENAVLRHQLIVLRRKVQGRVRLTNNDRAVLPARGLFFEVALYSGRLSYHAFSSALVGILIGFSSTYTSFSSTIFSKLNPCSR